MGFRILQVLAFLAMGFLLFKIWQRLAFMFGTKSEDSANKEDIFLNKEQDFAKNIEDLVTCNLCKLEIPLSSAIIHNKILHFCCEEHKNIFLNHEGS